MTIRLPLAFAAAIAALLLAGCNKATEGPDNQIGPNPVLPAPRQYLLPPMAVASPAPWAPGEAPTPGAGLRVQAFATGLIHPRSVFALPNGDILAVESDGPKAPVTGPRISSWA